MKWWDVLARAQGEHPAHHLKRREALASKKRFSVVLCGQDFVLYCIVRPHKTTMAKKSRLLAAIDEHQGRDYKLERQKKLAKKVTISKKSKSPKYAFYIKDITTIT